MPSLQVWGIPLLKHEKENGVKSTIQTDPGDYKGHTHSDIGLLLTQFPR